MGTGYLLSYDLGREPAEREVERERGREGKRETESESIRLTKKKKSHGNTKAIGFFYFIYLSYMQDCWALIYLTL